jgi:hypothetical protein
MAKYTLKGKKTYLIALAAVVYVIVNTALGQDVNVEVLTVALAAAGLRHAIN